MKPTIKPTMNNYQVNLIESTLDKAESSDHWLACLALQRFLIRCKENKFSFTLPNQVSSNKDLSWIKFTEEQALGTKLF